MNKINRTDQKSKSISDIIFVFSYFLSGAVIIKPCYIGINPVYAFVFLFVIHAVCTGVTVNCLKKQKKNSRFFAFVFFIISVFVFFVYINKYIGNFEGFFEYEQNYFAAISATIVAFACAFYGANTGRVSIIGFAGVSGIGIVLWRIMSIFGFFTTKKIMPIYFSFLSTLDIRQFTRAVTVLVVTVCDFYIIYRFFCRENGKGCEKDGYKGKSITVGVLTFLAFEYLNTIKNITLFGNEVLSKISNPDLASVRLFPFFELPELSIIVMMFAFITKLSVYFFFFKRFFEKLLSK